MSRVIERLKRIADLRRDCPDPLRHARPILKVVGGTDTLPPLRGEATRPINRKEISSVPHRRPPFH